MSKTRLSRREIIRKVWEWQKSGHAHPLTCGVDSSHRVLEPKFRPEYNKVVLVCVQCGYVREHIPEIVLRGVPPLPAIWLKRNVTVTIYKSAWQALLRGEKVAALRVFSKDELLNHQFGDKPEKYIMRVRITPVTE